MIPFYLVIYFFFYLSRIFDFFMDNRWVWFVISGGMSLFSIAFAEIAWRHKKIKLVFFAALALVVFCITWIILHEINAWYNAPLDPPLTLIPRPCHPYPKCLKLTPTP